MVNKVGRHSGTYRDERLGDQRPCASSKGPLRERRKGAADECRSDAQTHFGSAVSSVHEGVFAKRDEQVGDRRPGASSKGPLRERRKGAADECRRATNKWATSARASATSING
jgi:hypothetical protein